MVLGVVLEVMESVMERASRVVEICLGVFFVASAASKVVNLEGFAVQISFYGVMREQSLLLSAAYGTVGLEAVLGAAFIGGWRVKSVPYVVAGGLTIVFSALIAYAWRYKGLEDCGCFGDYLKMTPGQSLLKNVVLLGVLGAGWYGTRGLSEEVDASGPRSSAPIAAAILSLALVLGLGMYSLVDGSSDRSIVAQSVEVVDKDRPFQRFRFTTNGVEYDLGTGEYLVAMLNTTCEHCIASVPALNAIAASPDLPELVALMIADTGQEEEQLNEFRELTSPVFTTQLIEVLDFIEFLESAPPRLMFVREGREVSGWEWVDEAPTPESLVELIGS